MGEKEFRVLEHSFRKARPDCPRAIPWGLVEPHRARAKANHDQTLERLNQRGGMGVQELWFLLRDLPWGCGGVPTPEAALDDLLARVGAWEAGLPCRSGEHRWTGQRMGGPPDAAESADWVEYCDRCGAEKTEDD